MTRRVSFPFAAMIFTCKVVLGAPPNQVDGIAFIDRAAAGEISLGDVRGSIGVIDIDGDGWYDLFIADSSGRPNRLFRNAPSATVPGGRTFVDVTGASGVGDADGAVRAWGGVVVFDYDNDGDSDIYTCGNGASNSGVLYRNAGAGEFTNVSVAAGVRLPWTNQACASATDFDHDGYLDLLIVSNGQPGRTLALLKNAGNGTFADRSDLLPPVPFAGVTYAHAWTDYDHDGWEDALICFNNGVPLTLKNVANPTGGRMFVGATQASGFTRVGPAPMGIAIGDVNNDGWLDATITDAISGTYYVNNGGTFEQVFPYSTFFGWGTTFIDADNDGRLDNYQAGSFGSSNVDFLLRNAGNGQWTDARAALNTTSLPSQQCARIDFDNDGREDLVTINPGRFVSLYHNVSSPPNHWAKVRLMGRAGCNRDGAGAVIRLTAGGLTQVREIALGTSFTATEDPRPHFGLGSAAVIDRIEVLWPSAGSVNERTDVFSGPMPADEIVTLRRRSSCRADYDDSGGVELGDLYAFLAEWFARDPNADVNSAGGVSVEDLFSFLTFWFARC